MRSEYHSHAGDSVNSVRFSVASEKLARAKAEERLEHRGMAFVLLGFICFLGFLITDGMHAAPWVRATLMVSAIMLVLTGWGHYVASGLSEGRKQ